jgi:hypothetical protein
MDLRKWISVAVFAAVLYVIIGSVYILFTVSPPPGKLFVALLLAGAAIVLEMWYWRRQ